jgi:phosphomevalonate kinase
MNNTIILVSGKRYAGKSYTVELIHEWLQKHRPDMTVIVDAFGNALKQKYARDEQIDYDRLLNDPEFKEFHRPGLIKTGDWGRQQDSGYWPRTLLELHQFPSSSQKCLLVSDYRIPAEAEAIKQVCPDARLIQIRIQSSDEIRQTRGWSYVTATDTHPTEIALDHHEQWDLVVDNNFTRKEDYVSFLTPLLEVLL